MTDQRADITQLLYEAAYGDVLDELEDVDEVWAAWPRAEALFGLEDWDELDETLEAAGEGAGIPSERVAVMAGFTAVYRGALEEARGHFDQALTICADDPDALRGRARVLRYLGEDRETAGAPLLAALEVLPAADAPDASPRALHQRAQTLYDLGVLALEDDDYAGTELYWTEAAAARPDDGEHLLDLARLHARLERGDDAAAFALAAVEATPLLVEGYALAAKSLADAGRFEEAIEVAQQGVEVDPEEPFCVVSLAHTLLVAGELERAVETADLAIELDPTIPDPYQTKATALHALGRDAEFRVDDADFLQMTPLLPGFLFGELMPSGLSFDDVLAEVARMSPDDLRRAAEEALQSGLLPEQMRPMVESMMGQLPALMEQLPSLLAGGRPLTEVSPETAGPVLEGADLRRRLKVIDGGKGQKG